MIKHSLTCMGVKLSKGQDAIVKAVNLLACKSPRAHIWIYLSGSWTCYLYLILFSWLSIFCCFSSSRVWMREPCSIAPFHYGVSTLEPVRHGLNPLKTWIKWNLSSFKLLKYYVVSCLSDGKVTSIFVQQKTKFLKPLKD